MPNVCYCLSNYNVCNFAIACSLQFFELKTHTNQDIFLLIESIKKYPVYIVQEEINKTF